MDSSSPSATNPDAVDITKSDYVDFASSDDLERTREKMKINFFQIEKKLTDFDIKLDKFNKSVADLKDIPNQTDRIYFEKRFDESQKEIASLSAELKALSEKLSSADRSPLENKIAEFDSRLGDFEKELSSLKGLGKVVDKFESRFKEAEMGLMEMEANARKLFGKVESKFGETRKDLTELTALKAQLDEDRLLYTELRTAVLASIEKFSKLESELSQRIKETGALEKGIEEARNLSETFLKNTSSEVARLEEAMSKSKEELRQETHDEITRLEADSARLDQEIVDRDKSTAQQMKLEVEKMDEKLNRMEYFLTTAVNEFQKDMKIGKEDLESRQKESGKSEEELEKKLAAALDEKTESMQTAFGAYLDDKLSQNVKRTNAFGQQVAELGLEMTRVKREVVEKTIDDEMNKLLLILNEKMKNLVTTEDFAKIKSEMSYRLEQVRAPEVKPLEARIACLEDDISELKTLLRGVSQRLPVILE